MKTRVSSSVLLLGLCSALAPCVRAGSLWLAPGANERPMYADHKAGRVGDIVTIIVAEDVSQSKTQSKKTSTDGSTDSSVTSFLFPGSKMGTHLGALPKSSFAGTSAYSGGGSVSNTQSLTARAAVLVTDVLPNGNLVIQGVRRVTFSGETQHVVLHGTVRPEDILSDNTVASSSIAGARVEFISQGDLTEASKRGWISRLYEMIRPF